MYPIWLIVEYAITRLRSVTAIATVAANSSVASPMYAEMSAAVGASTKNGWARAIRYTPAVTIVAAWISADTGVGPSIASGSHVWSGSWADFANAPTRIRRQISTRVGSLLENVSGAVSKVAT